MNAKEAKDMAKISKNKSIAQELKQIRNSIHVNAIQGKFYVSVGKVLYDKNKQILESEGYTVETGLLFSSDKRPETKISWE